MAATQLILQGNGKVQIARRAVEEGWATAAGVIVACPDQTTNKTLITNLCTQNGVVATDLSGTPATLTDDKTKHWR